jgi:hypothetical protein
MTTWIQHLSHMFERRFWGARLIEIIGLALALVMIVWICLSKVREGEDVKRLKALNVQISEKSAEVNQLKVAVSSLERPGRLEALAHQVLGMASVPPARERDLAALNEISRTGTRPELPFQGPVSSAQTAPLDLAIETRPTPKTAEPKADAARFEIVVTDGAHSGVGR